jgi:flagellar basal body-associated protein FliL
MSKQPTTQPAPEAGTPAPPARTGRGISTKIKIAAFIVGVVAAEWVVAYLYLPSAAPAATTPLAPAGDHETAETPAAEPAAKHEPAGHGGGHASTAAKPTAHGVQQEADLGEFTVTAYQPVSSSTLFISFHLYGSVLDKHGEEFAKRLEEHKHQIRDNIIVIIRSAEITDLTDAGLGLIKRRILETTNKALGKPLLQGIMFSDFSFVEQ